MKEALTAMLGSKKVLTAVIAAVTAFLLAVAGKYGFVLDPATAVLLVKGALGLGATVVLGQGLADFGKEKAKIDSTLAGPDDAIASPAPDAPKT